MSVAEPIAGRVRALQTSGEWGVEEKSERLDNSTLCGSGAYRSKKCGL